jgi:AcrR family transcriptional regulator
VSGNEGQQRRRADAERNVARILDAAVGLLAEQPDASMAQVASAAGVARQTVYAHYDSREALLRSVAERALRQTLGAIEAAEPQRGPPSEALDRLVRAWWQTVESNARLLDALGPAFPDPAEVRRFHEPILERLTRLVRRGQRAGDFDRRLPDRWLTAAFLGLMHATAEEVATGRLPAERAEASLATVVPRLFGVGVTAGS